MRPWLQRAIRFPYALRRTPSPGLEVPLSPASEQLTFLMAHNFQELEQLGKGATQTPGLDDSQKLPLLGAAAAAEPLSPGSQRVGDPG